MQTEKLISQDEADEIAASLDYTGYTSVRVFEDGTWVSPAQTPIPLNTNLRLDSWDYTWSPRGEYQRDADEGRDPFDRDFSKPYEP